MLFFHLTTDSALPEILRNGLEPRHSQSSLAAVFLAGSEATAENYACMKDEPCTLLAIDLPDELLAHLQADNYELPDLVVDLPEDQLVEHGLWAEASWSDCNWRQSLAICDQVACFAAIPSSCISVHVPEQADAVREAARG